MATIDEPIVKVLMLQGAKGETGEYDDSALRQLVAGVAGDIATEQVTRANADDVLTERMDELVDQIGTIEATKITETVLFSSATPSQGNDQNNPGYFNLSDNVNNYDYIDIKYGAFGKTGIIRFDPDDILEAGSSGDAPHWSETQFNNGTTVENPHTVYRLANFMMYKFSNVNRVSIDFAMWGWNGLSDSNGNVGDATSASWKIGIYSITGVKYETVGATGKDSELTDIRVGVDGTVYGSAGTAVRTQLQDILNRLAALES